MALIIEALLYGYASIWAIPYLIDQYKRWFVGSGWYAARQETLNEGDEGAFSASMFLEIND